MDENKQRVFYYYVLLEPWSKVTFTPETFWKWVPQHFQEVRYAGCTVRKNPLTRFREHLILFEKFNRINQRTIWGHSLIMAGERPIFVVLESAIYDHKSGYKHETEFISRLKSENCNLLNATDGGEGFFNLSKNARRKMSLTKLGTKISEETREKLRKSHMGIPSKKRGVPLSDETKKKMSVSLTGLKHSLESREKRRKLVSGKNNPFYGKKHSDETKALMSYIHSNISEETRKKMSISAQNRAGGRFKGRHHTDASKKKISESVSKPVRRLDTGEVYSNAYHAQLRHAKHTSGISRAIKLKIRFDGSYWWYVNE